MNGSCFSLSDSNHVLKYADGISQFEVNIDYWEKYFKYKLCLYNNSKPDKNGYFNMTFVKSSQKNLSTIRWRYLDSDPYPFLFKYKDLTFIFNTIRAFAFNGSMDIEEDVPYLVKNMSLKSIFICDPTFDNAHTKLCRFEPILIC